MHAKSHLRLLVHVYKDTRCRSFYGTRAPDSWYEESSLLLGPDGEPVATEPANVDERAQRSEVAA